MFHPLPSPPQHQRPAGHAARPSRPRWWGLVAGGGIAWLLALSSPGARGEWTGLLVPAYFSPSRGDAWRDLADAAGQVPLIAIANVFDGPGTASRDDYRRAMDSVRDAGGRVIGYVHTTYTQRPEAEVMADIDRWGEFYTLDGVFVDEVTNDTDPNHLAYYAALREHARQRFPGWLVVGNPGTSTRESYLTGGAADVLVTFENRQGYPEFAVDGWTRRHSSHSFSHLAYEIGGADVMTNFVRLARQRGAGWVYFTDDTLPNPWDRLPTWWTNLTDHVRSLNAIEPTRLSIASPVSDSVRIRVETLPGPVTLEMSPNLASWQTLLSTVARTGRVEVLVTVQGADGRYLRARR